MFIHLNVVFYCTDFGPNVFLPVSQATTPPREMDPSAVNLTFFRVSHFRVTLASPNVTSCLLRVWPFVGRSLLRARKYKSRSSRTSSDSCNSLRFSCSANPPKLRCSDPAVSPSRFDVKPFRSFLDCRRSGRPRRDLFKPPHLTATIKSCVCRHKTKDSELHPTYLHSSSRA